MCLAVPGKVLDVQGDDPFERVGRVSFGGVVKPISLACTPDAKVGDYVLVHVGLAISVIDPAEAEETFRYLKEMGDLEGIEADDSGSAAPGSP
jgi:hydrogenase expression/formation protein HypC